MNHSPRPSCTARRNSDQSPGTGAFEEADRGAGAIRLMVYSVYIFDLQQFLI